MIIEILGVIFGFYGFTRKVLKNDPIRTHFDNFYVKINEILAKYKKRSISESTDGLLKVGTRFLVYITIAICLTLIFPKKIAEVFGIFLYPIFITLMGLVFSLKWIHQHGKSVKDNFLNLPFLSIVFLPLILHFLEIQGVIKSSPIEEMFIFKILPMSILYLQILWAVGIITMFYIGGFIIAVPMYLMIYSILFISSRIIVVFEKYINVHILDGIVGTGALLIVIAKAVCK
ncbi:hypothetical protein [Sphingobacterium haloxyli]|uniref:Uncharacterized protein n=1 Tax=Sphingobacterium haloxyli TaxID=2100533 RepID=A0A2S9J6W5_9SPHI|nr:hypothetical protein [Sphingobacterium haloxyli]PRD48525.1 hypothetical protein C5745_04810 [Sphingobacterium haloxyli]